MAINAALQHRSTVAGAVNSASLAFSSNNAAGSLLTCGVRYGPAGANVGVTDSQGNDWQPVADQQGSTNGVWLFCARNSAAGANTVTVTGDGVATSMRIAIAEYQGADLVAPLDVSAVGTATGTALSVPLTTNFDGELLVLVEGSSASSVVTAGSAQYTVEEHPDNFFSYTDGFGVSAGAEAGVLTLGTSATWIAVMAAFAKAGDPTAVVDLVPCTEPIGEFWDVPPYPMQQPKPNIAHLLFQAPLAPPTSGPRAHHWPAYERFQGYQQPPKGIAHQINASSDPFIFTGPRPQNWRAYDRPPPQVRLPFVHVADLPPQGPLLQTGKADLIVKNLRRGRR
ncbi:MAG: hypothetical protein V4457_05930 [Pseudomonadota bacterium]